MRAFANMPVESGAAGRAGWREVAFQRTPPLPSYLVAFAVGDFDVRDGGRAGQNETPISIVTPKGRAAEAAYAAAHAGAILARDRALLRSAVSVPQARPRRLSARSTFGSAMENPGLITYSARVLLARPDEMSPLFEQRFTGVTAHEIAHMWFGDYVTMAWWNDLWLNESFASWLGTARRARSARPTGRRRLALEPAHARRSRSTGCRPRAPCASRSPSTREVRAAFDGIAYAKGETVLAMFEQWLGPEKFRDGVRRYVAKHAWGNATADDFFAALAATDDAVVPAFRGFAERAGVPLLDVALDCTGDAVARACAAAVRCRWASPRAARDTWVVPGVLRRSATRRRAGRRARSCASETQVVPLPASACPQWVVANRSGIGYYLPRLSPALYDALPKAERVLAAADYGPLLGDLSMLSRRRRGRLRRHAAASPRASRAASTRARRAAPTSSRGACRWRWSTPPTRRATPRGFATTSATARARSAGCRARREARTCCACARPR